MYNVFVTDAFYMENPDNGCLDWATDIDKSLPEFESKKVETHETVEEALKSVENWGSKWVMYSGLIIEDEEGSEVYSDLAVLYRCNCCNNEKWERITSDLRTMKKADGSLMFPEIQ